MTPKDDSRSADDGERGDDDPRFAQIELVCLQISTTGPERRSWLPQIRRVKWAGTSLPGESIWVDAWGAQRAPYAPLLAAV
jgi:hypothetical protein